MKCRACHSPISVQLQGESAGLCGRCAYELQCVEAPVEYDAPTRCIDIRSEDQWIAILVELEILRRHHIKALEQCRNTEAYKAIRFAMSTQTRIEWRLSAIKEAQS